MRPKATRARLIEAVVAEYVGRHKVERHRACGHKVGRQDAESRKRQKE
jgi:hypothetical protein